MGSKLETALGLVGRTSGLAFAADNGTIYAIKSNGDLLCLRDVPRNGTPGWAPNSSNCIGSGWQDAKFAVSVATGSSTLSRTMVICIGRCHAMALRAGRREFRQTASDQAGKPFKTSSRETAFFQALSTVGRFACGTAISIGMEHCGGTLFKERLLDRDGRSSNGTLRWPTLGHLSILQQGKACVRSKTTSYRAGRIGDNDAMDNFFRRSRPRIRSSTTRNLRV